MLRITKNILFQEINRNFTFSRPRFIYQLLPGNFCRASFSTASIDPCDGGDSFGSLDPKFRDSKFKAEKGKIQTKKPANYGLKQNNTDRGKTQSAVKKVALESGGSILDKYPMKKDSWQNEYLTAERNYERSQDAYLQKFDNSEYDVEMTTTDNRALSSDVFGTLDPKVRKSLELESTREEEEDEIPQHIRLSKYGRKHEQCWYDRKILKLCNTGQVVTALDFLEEQMIKKDRVMPTVFAYAVVITGLGKCGHLKLAMELFYKMKEYGLKPNDYVFSSLFNACANAPVKNDGIQRANYLRQHMLEKNIHPAFLTYKAMIKAYAIHGELQTAFSLVDELVEAGYKADADCYAMLLIACISDKDAGYKHAIEVWRLMRKNGNTPQIFHYNLLVRAIRDCGIGSPSFARELLGKKRLKQLDSGEQHSVDISLNVDEVAEMREHSSTQNYWWQTDLKSETSSNEKSLVASEPSHGSSVFIYSDDAEIRNFPNFLSPKPDFRSIVGFANIETSGDRLALIGGIHRLLSHMKKDKVKPDIKTMTQMMDIIPSNTEVETALMNVMDKDKIEMDADFLNLMMKRRIYRKDLLGARVVFKTFTQRKLTPNFRTYGILALTCVQRNDGLQFLQDIKKANVQVTSEIYGHLLRVSNMDFGYKLKLCQSMQQECIKPGERGLRHIEKHINYAKQLLLKKERGESVPPYALRPRFNKEFEGFLMYYKSWLLSTEIQRPEMPYPDLRSHRIDEQNKLSQYSRVSLPG